MTPTLTERVLARLELHERPQLTLQGLRDLYGAWCRRVPFDNFRKLISLRSAHRGPLPGETPADFFRGLATRRHWWNLLGGRRRIARVAAQPRF